MHELRPAGSFLDGLSTGYTLFRADWKAWVATMALCAVAFGLLILALVWWPSANAEDPFSPASLFSEVVFSAGLQLVAAVLLALALTHVRTGRPRPSAAARVLGRAPVWVVSVLVGAVSGLLDIVLFGLGSFVSLLLVYVVLCAVDGSGTVAAFRDGILLLATPFWSRLGLLLVCSFVAGIGFTLLLVGAFVTVPVAALAVALSHVGDHDADSVAGPLPGAG